MNEKNRFAGEIEKGQSLEDVGEIGAIVKNVVRRSPKELWLGRDYLDELNIPMFAVDMRDKRKIVNWNKACVLYYDIPEKDHTKPNKYSIRELFAKIGELYTSGNEKILAELLTFYEKKIEKQANFPKDGNNGLTVFLPSFKDEKDFYRDYPRITHIFFKDSHKGYFIVAILIIPLVELISTDKLLSFLNKLSK